MAKLKGNNTSDRCVDLLRRLDAVEGRGMWFKINQLICFNDCVTLHCRCDLQSPVRYKMLQDEKQQSCCSGFVTKIFFSPADLNQKLLSRERTGPPLYLGSSTSRQCSCCVEAEPAAPSTALSLPTASRNLQPPRRAKCFGSLLTGWKEHYTMKKIKAVALERNGKYESKKTECCSLSWMLLHLIAFATAHYCEAQRGE